MIVMCNENKKIDHISNIMSKPHGIFTEKVTISFSNAGKTRNVSNSSFTNSRRSSFGDDINVTVIS